MPGPKCLLLPFFPVLGLSVFWTQTSVPSNLSDSVVEVVVRLPVHRPHPERIIDKTGHDRVEENKTDLPGKTGTYRVEKDSSR